MRLDFLGGAGGDGLAQHGVDLYGQMRAVLFDGGDGQDDDRVPPRLFAQLIRPQFAPFVVHLFPLLCR